MEELGKYGDGTHRGIRGLVDSIKEDIMRFFNKEKKRIRVISCHNRREMETLHDKYIERGIMAEESISVIPYSTINVYRLLVEEYKYATDDDRLDDAAVEWRRINLQNNE